MKDNKLINEVIKILDNELIEKNKKFISLGHANKILLEHRVISKIEKSNHLLKKLLEDNKIPNASQTNEKPRQWRIFLSEKGQQKKNTYENKKNKPNLKPVVLNTICPYCGINLTISETVNRCPELVCNNCNNQFKNPNSKLKEKGVKSVQSDDLKLPSNIKNWIFGALGLLVIYFFATDTTSKLKVKNSPWDSSVHQVESYIKNHLKDPDSFEAISWTNVYDLKHSDNGYRYKVRVRYRAKNSFGGYVIENELFYLNENGNVVKVE